MIPWYGKLLITELHCPANGNFSVIHHYLTNAASRDRIQLLVGEFPGIPEGGFSIVTEITQAAQAKRLPSFLAE
jgi:hypothetical protein